MDDVRAIRVRQLIGVYRFDTGASLVAARLTGQGCALRALTHRGLFTNPAWSAMTAELIVPVLLTHFDQSPAPVRAITGPTRPYVLARTRDAVVPLLGPTALTRIAGRVDVFLDHLRAATWTAGLTWTRGMVDSNVPR
ncbi:hypothetical protein Asi02nite_28140 [Asanoa siamensis]|uniref:Uncharacterized protein n=2 Tax=Asanoa siamensis TaxID=926357 RepID=A0ABQ4CPU3_9ACTN|nr:hypothetical protein Asi02nite_28140 [Asanoa siamensis]